tara:strand:+ start:203 stop:436 length:234 start_codon:yes stop_codon:yes gene_type:complete
MGAAGKAAAATSSDDAAAEAAAADATLAADAASKVEAKSRPATLNVDVDTRFVPLRFRWSDLMGAANISFFLFSNIT